MGKSNRLVPIPDSAELGGWIAELDDNWAALPSRGRQPWEEAIADGIIQRLKGMPHDPA